MPLANRPDDRATPVAQAPAPAPARLLLSPAEAEERLGISHWKMYDLLNSGEIQSLKMGSSRKIPVAVLEAYIAGKLAETAAAEQQPVA